MVIKSASQWIRRGIPSLCERKDWLAAGVVFAALVWPGGEMVVAQSPGLMEAQATPSADATVPNPSIPPASPSQSLEGSRFLGSDLPVFNPSTEMVTWDGRNWNVNDNRLFSARLEKYLNAPEENTEDDTVYRAIIDEILTTLAPGRDLSQRLSKAFELLPKASNYRSDANLCDSIAAAVFNVWLAQRDQARLQAASNALVEERRVQFRNAEIVSSANHLRPPRRKGEGGGESEPDVARDMRLAPYTARLAEITALLAANQARRELSEVQSKIEFQTLMLQLFLQRRFQHVLIAARFYQGLFADGDSRLRLEGDAKEFFAQTTGMPPTVAVLESLANEAMRDVREGIDAFLFLLEKGELHSAVKRLSETLVLGEYMPEMRTLPREKKRVALGFVQKSNQLLSALEVKDYALAEKIVTELEETVADFDSARPRGAIETARTVSALHLAKAKTAAASGDRATTEQELRAATEIWPRNPALGKVSALIFDQADVQQQALADLDRLLSQKNYRQIFEDRMRFIAASALYPERQEKLREVLETMQQVEAAIMRADEIAKTGNFMGAWESIEMAQEALPEDIRLSQTRSELTTRAADFVQSLRKAETLESQQQHGSSLAWYLRAQRLYPPSELARSGIERIMTFILPEEREESGAERL